MFERFRLSVSMPCGSEWPVRLPGSAGEMTSCSIILTNSPSNRCFEEVIAQDNDPEFIVGFGAACLSILRTTDV